MTRRVTHTLTVAKRNLYGSRLWWATCSCGKFFQGCFDKAEAQRLADAHQEKERKKKDD